MGMPPDVSFPARLFSLRCMHGEACAFACPRPFSAPFPQETHSSSMTLVERHPAFDTPAGKGRRKGFSWRVLVQYAG